MNNRYFATFVSGTQEIISSRLQRFANTELKVDELQDGLVFFTSALSINQLSELRFFNNVFGLLADLGTQSSIDDASKLAARSDMSQLPRKAGFKIYTRMGNQTIGLKERSALQQAVVDQTGGMPDSFQPDTELLLWMRDDGRTLWGWQLPRPGFKTRKLEPGELRPELAHIMGLLASVDSKDTVLDPFAGYGAIVRECLQGFHCQEVIAVEYNERLVPHLKSIPHLIAHQGDAARIPHVATRSIDRVITDPPWGRFADAEPEHLEHIYHESLIQMHRVLRVKGCVVMLTAVPFVTKLAEQVGFTLEKQYHILVNGQKADLYKFRKFAA
jgi:23S rRNA G2445 N2-methylase RlmL